jgi:glycerophosphoryl diester phosphodiesterase
MLYKKVGYRLLCLALLCMILNVNCRKNGVSDDTYFGGKLMIFGHRGMGVYYKIPGNTYESILPAVEVGADGCEIDLQLTSDSVLVLFHNDVLEPRTTCSGRINELTWAELKGCKYNALVGNVFVVSADELFGKLPDVQNLYFSFDSKMDYEVVNFDLYQSQFLRAIKRLCDKYHMSENVFLEGNESFLLKARSLGLTNKLFLDRVLNETSIETAINNSFFGICSQVGDIQVDTDIAHAKGLYIMAYSPYDYAQNKDAIRKKIDILQTDDPVSILKLFNRFNYEYNIP